MIRFAPLLLLLTAVSSPARAGDGTPLEGWRAFHFGMSRDQAMDLLGARGEVHAGAVRSTVDIDGVPYEMLLKFPSGRLHEIYLRSGLAWAKPKSDQECYTDHMARVRDTEAAYGVKGETETTSIGAGVRYVFTRTRFAFADGARIVAENKFVPSLGGNGLCESTILYQEGERTGP